MTRGRRKESHDDSELDESNTWTCEYYTVGAGDRSLGHSGDRK